MQRSIKKRIILILAGLLVPIVLMLNVYALFLMRSVRSHVEELNHATLQRYATQIDETLSYTDSALVSLVTNNATFRSLGSRLDADTAYFNAYEVEKELSNLLNAQSYIAGCVVYSTENDLYRAVYASWYTGVEQKEEIRSHFSEWEDDSWEAGRPNWRLLWFGQKPLLCRKLNIRGAYLFCLVDPQRFTFSTEEGTLLQYASGGEWVTERELLAEVPLPGPDETGLQRVNGANYMLTRLEIGSTELDICLLSPYDAFRASSAAQIVLMSLSFLAVLLVPLAYLLISRALFRPVDSLVQTMARVRDGDLAQRADTNFRDGEFALMGETMNAMLDQIESLKILSYEREIAAKQSQLQFLQIQIRPHFYLNCLKSIYALLDSERYEEAKRSTILLSEYLRYMMQIRTQNVTLQRELKNVQSYIKLQQLSLAYPPQFESSVDTSLLGLLIPPITILTFVENSIKHADMAKRLHITVKARLLHSEQGDVANITIADNGTGFAAGQLERLNALAAGEAADNQTGVSNVCERLRLMYGERAAVTFSNNGGAVVDLYLPAKEEAEFEPADCG